MHLIIDIGNSRSKVALFYKDQILSLKFFDELTIEHLDSLFKEFEKTYSEKGSISGSILSSVRQDNENIKLLLKRKSSFIELNAAIPLPIKVLYKTPETLGNDRIALAVGATIAFPSSNVLVIDAGTCITYDFVSAKNDYFGGGISPGIMMRYKALHTFTDKLPLVNNLNPADLIGQTTQTSIQSGVMNGVLAETDGIIDKYKALFPDLKTIVTGGDTYYFDKNLKNNIFANSNLVLEGLNRILNFNDGK